MQRPFITPTAPVARAKLANAAKQCQAPGCSAGRYQLNMYCGTHQDRYRKYGNPLGVPIRKATYAPYRALVRQLFEANADHAGLLQAHRWVADLMAQAVALHDDYTTKPPKGTAEWQRLAGYGVQPMDILVEACAVHYVLQSARECKTDKARDVAMSRAVFMLAPRPRKAYRSRTTGKEVTAATKPRTSALSFTGQHIRRSLGTFMANVAQAIEAMPDTRAQALAAMRAPFNPPTSAYIDQEATAATP